MSKKGEGDAVLCCIYRYVYLLPQYLYFILNTVRGYIPYTESGNGPPPHTVGDKEHVRHRDHLVFLET